MTYEYLGWFGLSWQERIAAIAGFPITVLNGSIYGALVNNIIKLNASGKYKNIEELATSLNTDSDKIRKVLLAYENFKKTKTVFLEKPISTGIKEILKNVGESSNDLIKPITNSLIWPIAIIASIAGIVYLTVTKGKK